MSFLSNLHHVAMFGCSICALGGTMFYKILLKTPECNLLFSNVSTNVVSTTLLVRYIIC